LIVKNSAGSHVQILQLADHRRNEDSESIAEPLAEQIIQLFLLAANQDLPKREG
jgi:hypothetical protein